jgi:hypothetical protein
MTLISIEDEITGDDVISQLTRLAEFLGRLWQILKEFADTVYSILKEWYDTNRDVFDVLLHAHNYRYQYYAARRFLRLQKKDSSIKMPEWIPQAMVERARKSLYSGEYDYIAARDLRRGCIYISKAMKNYGWSMGDKIF